MTYRNIEAKEPKDPAEKSAIDEELRKPPNKEESEEAEKEAYSRGERGIEEW